jgi:hypothetical protein
MSNGLLHTTTSEKAIVCHTQVSGAMRVTHSVHSRYEMVISIKLSSPT